MDASVLTQLDEPVTTVFVAGEIDIASAIALRDGLSRALELVPSSVVVDLAGVVFIDCSGLRTLLLACRAAEAMKKRMYLAAVPDQAERVIRLAGLSDAFHYRDGPASAMREPRGMARDGMR